MNVLAWITGIVLIAGFGMAGAGKLMGQQMMKDTAKRFGFKDSQFQMLGGAEVAGAAGILVGLFSDGRDLELLGLLAAVGLILVGLGAVFFHRKFGDEPKDFAPALMLAVAAVLYIVFIGAR